MRTETDPPWFSAADITTRISPGRARRLIQQVLQSDFDPASDPDRINSPAGAGHLLLMPSVLGDWAGDQDRLRLDGQPGAWPASDSGHVPADGCADPDHASDPAGLRPYDPADAGDVGRGRGRLGTP
ncbi:hypothetical protein GCM10027402_16780 [Arthrobacter monumenti]